MIDKIHARSYCCEDISLIENYQEAVADETQVWHIHHRRETDEGIPGKELIRRGEYLHRPAAELIFLTKSQHHRLHNLGKKYMLGKHLSETTREKISKALSGGVREREKNPFFGKTHTEEARKKMSAARSGGTLSGENNGFFGKTHTEEARKKMSQAQSGNKHLLGYHWWNNGVKNVLARECPEGFVRGRLPWKKMEKKEDEQRQHQKIGNNKKNC